MAKQIKDRYVTRFRSFGSYTYMFLIFPQHGCGFNNLRYWQVVNDYPKPDCAAAAIGWLLLDDFPRRILVQGNPNAVGVRVWVSL